MRLFMRETPFSLNSEPPDSQKIKWQTWQLTFKNKIYKTTQQHKQDPAEMQKPESTPPKTSKWSDRE